MMKRTIIAIMLLAFPASLFAQISMEKTDEGILITEDGQNVLFYQTKPKSLNGTYERCNYIHPLWSPGGTVMTEDFPADHLHHRGIFWAWHQVWIQGKRIGDPWEIKNFEQEVLETEFIRIMEGAVQLKTEVAWKSPDWKINGEFKPYIREITTVTVHPKSRNYRKLDFEIRLLALADDLTIGGSEDDKGYSGFSVRMKLPEDVSFTGPEGKVEPMRNAVVSKGYVDVSGTVLDNGGKGGIVMLDHPENPGYPQPWILRDRRSMQNPQYPGTEPVPVSTEKPLVLKYSLLVYEGKLSEKEIQQHLKQ